jgi:hypothetical protein
VITCIKCQGKVFVDLTFTDNRNYETFCLRCGDRKFIGPSHELFTVIKEYVKSALVA